MSLNPGEAEAVFEFHGIGSAGPMFCTLGFSDSTALSTIAEDCKDAWFDNLLAFQASTLTFDGVVVHVGQDPPPDVISEASSGAIGGQVTDAEPANVAVLVQKATGIAGRQNRGRMFIPGFCESEIATGGVLTPTAFTDLGLALVQFQVDLELKGHTMGILHKEVNIAERVIPAVVQAASPATPLLDSEGPGLRAQSKVATQRRRLR